MPHALAIAKAKAFVCLSIDLGQSNKPSMQRLLTARRDRWANRQLTVTPLDVIRLGTFVPILAISSLTV